VSEEWRGLSRLLLRLQPSRACAIANGTSQEAILNNQYPNRHPQRLAAAGVLLFGLLVAGCQETSSQAADPNTGPADVSAVAAVQGKAPRVPASDVKHLPADACVKSERGFSEFFDSFAQDRPVRESHSAPMIQIGDIKNPNGKGAAVALHQIEPFRIALVDNQWVYEEPGKPPGELARVDISRTLDGEAMRVEFVRAEFSADDDVLRTMGDAEAYVFVFRNGCWQLTEYLR
jgi:hypothetical protein